MSKVADATRSIAPKVGADSVQKIRTNYHVHVVMGADTPLRLIQAKLTVRILIRIFTRVTLSGIADAKSLELPPSLAGGVKLLEEAPKADLTLALTSEAQQSQPCVYVGQNKWAARLSTQSPRRCRGANPLSAMYAAALACQHAFNHAFRSVIENVTLLEGQAEWDLASGAMSGTPDDVPVLEKIRQPLELDAMLVGAGAVGQAIAYALGECPPLSGRLEIVDCETLDEGNTERYILASQETTGQHKAFVIRQKLAPRHPFLCVQVPSPPGNHYGFRQMQFQSRHILPANASSPGWPIPSTPLIELSSPHFSYHEWREMGGESPRQLAITAVDSKFARRDIQFGLHRGVLNVWTDNGPGISTWGRDFHTIGSTACVACMYHESVEDPGDQLAYEARQVGWSVDRVREHLENPDRTLSHEDLDDLRIHSGFSEKEIQQIVASKGNTLRGFINGLCGLGTGMSNDRRGAPPLPHVPVIVGIHAAAALLLRALGWEPPLRVNGNALNHASTSYFLPVPNAHTDCLCQDKRVQQWFKGYWESSG